MSYSSEPVAGGQSEPLVVLQPAPGRVLAPDLARGFMLLGIALANVSVYLWGQQMFDGLPHPTGGSVVDTVLSVLAMLLIEQRIYPMFAFLFGYGIVQFAWSRHDRGRPVAVVRRMLLRRHLWLIAFGAVHAALLFGGDILGAYGLTGLILTALFFAASDRAIKITVWVLVGITACGAFAYFGIGWLLSILPSDVTGVGDFAVPSNADLLSGEANYGLSVLWRLGLWLLATPGTVVGLIVPAMVLLGMLAARHRWIEAPGIKPRLGIVAGWGILISVVGAAPTALVYLGVIPGFEQAGWAFIGFTQLSGIAGGLGYAALFGLVGIRVQQSLQSGRREAPPVLVTAVAAVGKRSLSFYLLQSLIFAPLLAAWGLGWGSWISATEAFGIAACVWLLSVALAAVLEHRGARGPAEVLLRRLTYGRDDLPRSAASR